MSQKTIQKVQAKRFKGEKDQLLKFLFKKVILIQF